MNTNSSLHPCTCRNFEAGNRVDVEGGDVDFIDVRTTGCTASTTRLFAQGHDAKLVSFLVAAELANLEIALVGQGSSWGRAEDAARTISDALASKAQAMIATAKAKANKPRRTKTPTQAMNDLVERQAKAELAKRTPAAVEATQDSWDPEAEVALAPRKVTIKVGRWTYMATVDAAGDAHYFSPSKGDVTLAVGSWKEHKA